MKKPRINQALNELINERQADRETAARPVMGKLLTGSSGTLAIDISGIRVMRGLNVLVDTLIKSVLDQCAFGHSDVLVEQHVSQEQQPEHPANESDAFSASRTAATLAISQVRPARNVVALIAIRMSLPLK